MDYPFRAAAFVARQPPSFADRSCGYLRDMKQQPLTSADDVRSRVVPGLRGCRVEMVPGGPALVRGAEAVTDSDGTAYSASRPVVAVCTCGLTQRGPWCDATHKVIPS